MCDVSVIILAYNQENTILRTLESIKRQQTSYEYEIIIGDDASSDRTRILCEKFKIENTNIHIDLNDIHSYWGVVRNYFDCVRRCSGKYIMGCAGDDWWHNTNKIQIQVDYLESHPTCVLHYGGYNCFYPVNNSTHYNVKPMKIKGDLFKFLLLYNPICAPSVCYRLSALKNNIDKILSANALIEDYPTWLALSFEGEFHCTDDSLVTYSIEYGSVSHCKLFEKKLMYLEDENNFKVYFARLYNKDLEYKTLLYDVDLFKRASFAIQCGERKAALHYLKLLKNKNMKIYLKILICSIGSLFKFLYRRYNKNMI